MDPLIVSFGNELQRSGRRVPVDALLGKIISDEKGRAVLHIRSFENIDQRFSDGLDVGENLSIAAATLAISYIHYAACVYCVVRYIKRISLVQSMTLF